MVGSIARRALSFAQILQRLQVDRDWIFEDTHEAELDAYKTKVLKGLALPAVHQLETPAPTEDLGRPEVETPGLWRTLSLTLNGGFSTSTSLARSRIFAVSKGGSYPFVNCPQRPFCSLPSNPRCFVGFPIRRSAAVIHHDRASLDDGIKAFTPGQPPHDGNPPDAVSVSRLIQGEQLSSCHFSMMTGRLNKRSKS
jgi:hypothetical protein